MSEQVWVVGEVLIDLIPDVDHQLSVVGGGPANTAKALAKLGVKTHFIDGISNDKYGQIAQAELISANVSLDYAQYSNKPTVLQKSHYLHQEVHHMNLKLKILQPLIFLTNGYQIHKTLIHPYFTLEPLPQ